MKCKALLVLALSIVSCQGSKGNGGNTNPPADRPVNPDDPGKGGNVVVDPECISYKNGEELASKESYLELLSKVISNKNPEDTKALVAAAQNGEITCK